MRAPQPMQGRHQSHPISSAGAGRFSSRSTAIISAVIASISTRGFGRSIRQPRPELGTVCLDCITSEEWNGVLRQALAAHDVQQN
jgi:hypothetical protein